MTLERPSRSEHGDYATNVALRLGPQNGKPPRELAEQLAREATELEAVERAEVAGPGFLNLFLRPSWYTQALGEILEAGEMYGGAFRGDGRARAGRDGLGEPDRPADRRLRAERGVRRRRRSPARVRGQRGRARVLLQRRRSPDRALPRVRRGPAAGRGAPRGRLHGRVPRGDRGRARGPGRQDAGRDQARARRVPDPLRLVGPPAGDHAPGGGRIAPARDLRGGGNALGANQLVRRRQGPTAQALGRRQLSLLRRRTWPTSGTSSSVGSTG